MIKKKDYRPMQKRVSEMIEKYGRPMLLQRTRFVPNPAGGGGSDQVVAKQEVSALQTDFNHGYVDGTIINTYDVRFYVGTYKLHPELANMSPLGEIELIDPKSGREWQLKHVKTINPGDLNVLFDIHAF